MKIEIKEKIKSGTLKQQKLSLLISGDNINHKFINGIRRISKLNIPTYAYYVFEYIENTSIFNNDMMRLRLENIVPQNVDIKIDYLEQIYHYDEKKSQSFEHRQRHENDKFNFEFHINVENKDSNTYVNYTTDDMSFYLNGNKIDPQIKNPCLIIQLRKGEKFVCKAKAIIGTCMGLNKFVSNNKCEIWAASRNTYYKEINKNSFLLTLESKGQMNELEILKKCCKIIFIKIGVIEKTINNNTEKGTILELKLDDDDSVLGMLNYELQSLKEVLFSSCNRKVATVYETILSIKTDKKNVFECISDAISKVKKNVSEFEKELNKIKY